MTSLNVFSAVTYVIRADDNLPALASLSTLAEVRAWGRERGLVLRRIAPGDVGLCHRLDPRR
jgi:hypothetical protein